MRASGGGRWLERLQFTLLFLVLTVMVHHVFAWMQDWIVPFDPYKVPEGGATKVFRTEAATGSPESWEERLKLFLWLGE
ncbi:hypothetical protein J19TS2_13120 [Cohnella xylanilytica]|uniref:DUF4227 family protein n=1 Tax=Cohnella xylanilytica TaxID=557555 RepID=A0A841UAR5_9BACL|nr:DUF4227 family protein [Cohnella xylanilytica]MBB6696068.1 DUF4227 family protein [Cohnella xylanilytica]GIO11757.1 hypothetical protein J19TS2_13120 [Cohnella xylanilytica]